jgi:hypothetical protein
MRENLAAYSHSRRVKTKRGESLGNLMVPWPLWWPASRNHLCTIRFHEPTSRSQSRWFQRALLLASRHRSHHETLKHSFAMVGTLYKEGCGRPSGANC